MEQKVFDIVVVGSINMDLVTKATRFPKKGETILGEHFTQTPGGKGANQAVAAARLGASVAFIGALGDDQHGRSLMQNLKKEHVNVDYLKMTNKVPTGIAQITLAENENHIIVVPGANFQCLPKDIQNHEALIKNARIVLVQLEIPFETVEMTINLANKYNTKVILNPAPARKLPKTLIEKVDYLVPNESEIKLLTNKNLSIEESITQLIQLDVKGIIITLGSKGVFYQTRDQNTIEFVPSFQVNVVDTTGAGDGFIGGLAVALSEQMPLHRAIQFANAVGALVVTKSGAQKAMPLRQEVEDFLNINLKEWSKS